MAGININVHGVRLTEGGEISSRGTGVINLTDGKGAHDCITLFFDHPAEADEVANEIKTVARRMRKQRNEERDND